MALSKISVQALDDRVAAFELNTIRSLFLLFQSSFYFMYKKKLPHIHHENIRATVLWSMNQNFMALTAFISVVHIPLATGETVTILSNIFLTVLVFLVVLKQDVHWSQVLNQTNN